VSHLKTSESDSFFLFPFFFFFFLVRLKVTRARRVESTKEG